MEATLSEQTEVAKRNDVGIKIDAEVAANAKTVADFMKIGFSEYISERLRPLVLEDLEREAKKFLERQKRAKG